LLEEFAYISGKFEVSAWCGFDFKVDAGAVRF